MARIAYNLGLLALLPFIGPRLAWRARRQPEYLKHVGERFGSYPPREPRPTIWLHAVSVGETRAAQPLIAGLLARYPDHELVVSHMTPTGRQTSAELFGTQVTPCYLPYDYPWAMGRFLDHFAPRLGIVLETEIWPNLIAACRARNLPLLLVNARMSEKSARRYAFLAKLARDALQSFAAIAAQTDTDARRLLALGAPEARVFGNIKFDLEPPEAQIEAGLRLKSALGDRPVFLCASTRDGEERLIIDALCRRIEASPTAREAGWPAPTLVIIVPRHPQRFNEVAGLIEGRGLRVQRRSTGEPVAAETQVLLGDTMGELYAYYGASDAAYVGGSLLPLGGQNLIEACAVGTPVLVGPHTFNFAEATEQAIAAGAAQRIANAEELLSHAAALLSYAQARSTMGKAGRQFIATHRGATHKTLELIRSFLEPTPTQP